MKSQVARSREGDPDHWIQATGEPLDQNLHVVSRIRGSGLKEFLFDCRSREVSSIEGSCEHVSHPLGGDHVVDRWHNNKHQRKVEACDRWWTHIAWEGVNPLLTFRISGIRKGGARGFNTPTHEVTSCK
jgi:hypothetical protein